jgi:glycerate kinase
MNERQVHGPRIVIAPDSFKEGLGTVAVADALARGLRRALRRAEIVRVPMADGGEGMVAAVLAATGGRQVKCSVTGPLGAPVRAMYGVLPDGTAVIEMASASGLPLVPPAERNPLRTTSRGTGELIAHALRRGARRVIVGLGGSATNDAGAGMAQALGVRFLDRRGRTLDQPLGGGDLGRIAGLRLAGRLAALEGAELLAACDVRNPLCGPRGASVTFGPQKGATAAQVRSLDRHLAHFGALVEAAVGRRCAGRAGAGAAGGVGFGLLAFCGARLVPGVELVAGLVGLEARVRSADLVITAEGRVDGQTGFGKTPAGVAALARRCGVPVVVVGGGLAPDARALFAAGIDALEPAVCEPMQLEAALHDAAALLEQAGERVGRWLLLGRRLVR